MNLVYSKHKKTCFLTTVFPCPVIYLNDFLQSLTLQDYTCFDLVIVNDGNQDLNSILKSYPTLTTYTLDPGNNPIENRERLIRFAINFQYDIAIFGDCDDKFSTNRVSETINCLENSDIVVNDLSSFDAKGMLKQQYISKRFNDKQIINFNDIFNFNIFGLSNTGINVDTLKNIPLPFPKDLIALDWFLYAVLLHKGYQAIFTKECLTHYRQHVNNIAGLGSINVKTIKKSVLVKIQHYKNLSKLCPEAAIEYSKLINNLEPESAFIKYCERTSFKLNINQPTPLWWEL